MKHPINLPCPDTTFGLPLASAHLLHPHGLPLIVPPAWADLQHYKHTQQEQQIPETQRILCRGRARFNCIPGTREEALCLITGSCRLQEHRWDLYQQNRL